jgi:hypothetical protein
MVYSVSLAFSETIYLKDGSFVKGTIKSEDDKTIFLELTDSWKKINKSTIERIIKDDSSAQGAAQQLPYTRQSDVDNAGKIEGRPSRGLEQLTPVEKGVALPDLHQQAIPKKTPTNVDIRAKYGIAPGADNIQFTPVGDKSSNSDKAGRNVQVEVAISPKQDSMAGPVFSVGVFKRQHSGRIIESSNVTTMDYDASGVCIGGGLRLKASDNFHFEVKIELGLGQGDVTLESSNSVWNQTKKDTYTSAALITGWYYTFSKPGIQLGFEIGAQTFTGEFELWNDGGYWASGKVIGTGFMGNLALGLRF